MFMFRHNILSLLSQSNDCPDDSCLLIKYLKLKNSSEIICVEG